MSVEQAVIEAIRTLSPEQQQAVLEFSEFLAHKNKLSLTASERGAAQNPEEVVSLRSQLGQKLYKIRQRAVNEGMQLSTAGEIDSEIADHRRYRTQHEDVS